MASANIDNVDNTTIERPLEFGDYVLATKYGDGDPGDQWCIGFFAGTTPTSNRFLVVDSDGKSFRHSGFRRCERIPPMCGKVILEAGDFIGGIGRSPKSLWYWKRNWKKLADIIRSVHLCDINREDAYASHLDRFKSICLDLHVRQEL